VSLGGAGEEGGATLVGLALTGLVLLAGVAAVDIGALAAARAAAQTAADMAALAALTPQDGSAATPQDGSAAAAPQRRAQAQGSVAPAAQRGATARGSAGAHAENWREERAAEIAAANGAELVDCDCSAVRAVVGVRRRQRLVPGGLTVVLTARARAVLGQPPAAGRATVRAIDLSRAVDGSRATRPRDPAGGDAAGRPARQCERGDGGGAVRSVGDRGPGRRPRGAAHQPRGPPHGPGWAPAGGGPARGRARLLRVRWERLRLFALLGLVLFAAFPLTFNIGLRYTEASRAR
jgi:Flp pilus assembly protein TadG